MQDNIIICNNSCSATCMHCLYGQANAKYNLAKDAKEKIYDIQSDLVILSGGEPFELSIKSFGQYTAMCTAANKYFKIATGGHAPIQKYLPLFITNPLFPDLQFGTDVLSHSRNLYVKKHINSWRRNIKLMHEYNILYSLTITFSADLDIESILKNAYQTTPQYILLNYLDGISTITKEQSAIINSLFPNTAYSK